MQTPTAHQTALETLAHNGRAYRFQVPCETAADATALKRELELLNCEVETELGGLTLNVEQLALRRR